MFDSNFLQFEYRHFLDQIGFVPGMAAHTRSSLGPYGIVAEWNSAISEARLTDDDGNPIAIMPSAWQIRSTINSIGIPMSKRSAPKARIWQLVTPKARI